jgi:hypothetical protein
MAIENISVWFYEYRHHTRHSFKSTIETKNGFSNLEKSPSGYVITRKPFASQIHTHLENSPSHGTHLVAFNETDILLHFILTVSSPWHIGMNIGFDINALRRVSDHENGPTCCTSSRIQSRCNDWNLIVFLMIFMFPLLPLS